MAFPASQRQPQLQQKAKCYSGQWTKEEQDYVTCLMDGFKNGTLDIADGTSLRYFIAAKLGCKPKRVSKKYERSGYNGKQVYRRDSSVSSDDLEAYRQRLNDCEAKFRESRALVVSMQEAKSADSPKVIMPAAPTETPVISLTASNANNTNSAAAQALEDRLIAMRSQIDRTSRLLAATSMPFSAAGLGPLNPPPVGFGPLNPPPAAPLSPDVLMLMNRQQRNQQALYMPSGGTGFGGGFQVGGAGQMPLAQQSAFSLGLPPSMPMASTAAATNNSSKQLLLDLYKRRQQLMAPVMATAAPRTPPPSSPVMGMSPSASPKRSFDEAEEDSLAQAYKRARAA